MPGRGGWSWHASVLALIAAVAGTALAGPVANTATDKVTKREKSKMRKIATNRANKQISKLESGLNVNSAKSADRAIRANQAGSAGVAFRAGSADTADTAKSALNAGAANGVRPVRVNRAIQDGTSNTLLLSEGGLRIDAECDGNGNAGIGYAATANNGALHLVAVTADGNTLSNFEPDADEGPLGSVTTQSTNPGWSTTVTYRGANGTTVSGQLMQTRAQATGVGRCVIAGTLFVG